MFTKQRFLESLQVGFIVSVASMLYLLMARFSSPAYSDVDWIKRLNLFCNVNGESILTIVSLFVLVFLLNLIGLPLFKVFRKLINKAGVVVEDVEEEIERRIDVKEKTYLNGDIESDKAIKELCGENNEKRD